MKQLKRPLIYESQLLKKYPKVVAGFTSREMGNTKGLRIIRKLAQKLNFPFGNICFMKQVHGDNVALVNKGEIRKNFDGMITRKEGLLLLTQVADCLPILFFEPQKRIIGVCHSGRIGTELKITEKIVFKIINFGGDAQELIIVIGPHIKKCCYPVDLTKENKEQLLNSGVKLKNIEIFSECTCCGENFFSYRRDGRDFFEFAGFIGMREDI